MSCSKNRFLSLLSFCLEHPLYDVRRPVPERAKFYWAHSVYAVQTWCTTAVSSKCQLSTAISCGFLLFNKLSFLLKSSYKNPQCQQLLNFPTRISADSDVQVWWRYRWQTFVMSRVTSWLESPRTRGRPIVNTDRQQFSRGDSIQRQTVSMYRLSSTFRDSRP